MPETQEEDLDNWVFTPRATKRDKRELWCDCYAREGIMEVLSFHIRSSLVRTLLSVLFSSCFVQG